jgi:hypothetical protein
MTEHQIFSDNKSMKLINKPTLFVDEICNPTLDKSKLTRLPAEQSRLMQVPMDAGTLAQLPVDTSRLMRLPPDLSGLNRLPIDPNSDIEREFFARRPEPEYIEVPGPVAEDGEALVPVRPRGVRLRTAALLASLAAVAGAGVVAARTLHPAGARLPSVSTVATVAQAPARLEAPAAAPQAPASAPQMLPEADSDP